MNEKKRHAVSLYSVQILAAAVLAGYGAVATAQIQFEDVSAAAGMKGFTETWGGSWGDLNGDNWPDLINQGHREYPRVFRNTGEGTFEDIAYEVDPGNWIAFPFDDKHGVTFVDYDNDGDEDLMFAVSATGDAQFLINDGGVFTDRATDAGLAEDEAARMATFFDFDNDGHLDVLQGYTKGAVLRRRDPLDATFPEIDFDDVGWQSGLFCPGKHNYEQLIDLDGDGSLELVCMQEGIFPIGAFDYTTFPFTNVTSSLPPLSNVNDTAVADLNNDLLSDMIVTRGAIRPSGATLVNSNRIEAWLRKDDEVAAGKGFTFESNGEITITVDSKGMGLYADPEVFVLDPISNPSATLIVIEESPEGSMTFEWDSNESLWRVEIIEVEKSFQAYLQIDTNVPVTNLTEVNFDTPEFATETVHLENGPGGLTPNFVSGLYTPVFCVSVAAGDFDNDMDQDVYLVCRRGPDNLPNRLYENQGDGTFVEVTGFGAEGPVGTSATTIGLGESVAVADYDVDGFLDLYVTNGLLYYPINVGGPENLFRNLGNSNHWLEIDLQGAGPPLSNRDGVGAKVYVTAGGVTQLREQNAGIHRWSQNHQRLHIGLGSNTTADVTIEWPSGETDTHIGVAADTLYDALENGAMTPAVLGPPVHTQLNPGDECGQPPYNFDYGPAVLLWKNCSTNVWRLRAKGGRNTEVRLNIAGQIIADGPFSQVTEFNLSAGTDSLDNSFPDVIEFSVGAWFANNNGFSFSTAGQSTSCLSFDEQEFPALIVGSSKKSITGGFDLINLTPCDPPPPPPDLLECGEPVIDNNTENGLFLWRDCDIPVSSIARWNFTLSAGGAPFASYSGLIDSDVVLAAVGTDIEPNDTLDSVPGDNQIDFTLNVGGNGVDKFLVDVPVNSQSCIDTSTLPAGTPVLIGDEKKPRTDSFDLVTLDTCNVACHP